MIKLIKTIIFRKNINEKSFYLFIPILKSFQIEIYQSNFLWINQYMLTKNIKLTFSEVLRFQNYSIRLLTHEHRVPTLKFLQEQFINQQPSQRAFYKQFPQHNNNSYLYWERVQRLFAGEIFQRGLSFGCFDLKNGSQLVGAILSKDNSFTPELDPYPEEGSFIYAVRKLKEKMYAQIIPEYYDLINEGNAPIIDVWLAAIKSKHQKKGILHKMMIQIQRAGVKQSYKYAISWATNKNTIPSHKKLGYIKVSEVNAKEFEYNGVKYFKEVEEDQVYQSLWIKELKKQHQM